jgi:hypothetical protein
MADFAWLGRFCRMGWTTWHVMAIVSSTAEMLDRETGPELLFRDRGISRSRRSTPEAIYEEPKVEVGIGLGSQSDLMRRP